jgi:protein-S-isoprenylcysteine O-methyltransferase Ste14
MYVRLAKTEERWTEQEFGDEYRRYTAETPAFIPHLKSFTGAHDAP